jgi:hypothetical protein
MTQEGRPTGEGEGRGEGLRGVDEFRVVVERDIPPPVGHQVLLQEEERSRLGEGWG